MAIAKRDSAKIRNLIESDKIDICWDDILRSAIEVSHPLREIEFRSNVTDLKNTRKCLRILKARIKAFEKRMKNEVEPSVISLSKRKKSSKNKGNAEALMKYQQNR